LQVHYRPQLPVFVPLFHSQPSAKFNGLDFDYTMTLPVQGARPAQFLEWNSSNLGREELMHHEWLVTNGLGGYSSSTITGVMSRRYHGLLVAAIPAPIGRMIVFNHVAEFLRFAPDDVVSLGDKEGFFHSGPGETAVLTGFRLDDGLPVWRYEVRGIVLEKRLLLLHRQNTVHVNYRLLQFDGPEPPRLELRPAIEFRYQSAAVNEAIAGPYQVTKLADRYEISAPSAPWLPPLRLRAHAASTAFRIDEMTIDHVIYPSEEERGDPNCGKLWSPGIFSLAFDEHNAATLVGSTETWDVINILRPDEASDASKIRRIRILAEVHEELRDGFGADLALAADQFISTPRGRLGESARAYAQGDDIRTIMAGYHWFTDWGRDTMISLEGLTLLTGRSEDAKYILHTFSHYIRNGLIPNLIPEGATEEGGRYNAADATLWYFHALSRYLDYTGDTLTLKILLPKLVDIIEHHFRGTDFHIRVDPIDGLLSQGEEGYQLTWMDAKAGDWVVTPRRGKAVEINALWFNALSLLSRWLREAGNESSANEYAGHAKRAAQSFNQKFWNPERNCLFDVIDGPNGNEAKIRPNQVFAISLPNPVLQEERWAPVIKVVEEKLLTPVGLRTLSRDDPDYKPTYRGDRLTRDAAYHQGTVWPWLIGPYVDAWLKLHPSQNAEARKLLARFPAEMTTAGMGTLAEVFHAEPPHLPRGCIAQAWSVAEVLRSWVKTA
jgi:predicted glycogen debranching enzyme